jgi:2-phospho-L-lactate guanylyltransferase
VAAVVPVKALGAAKSRLSSVLGEGERAALALWLLGRVVAAIGASGEVADVAVVSPDEAALGHARAEGAVTLRQGAGDLGAAIEQGREWAIDLGAGALLVALGDLPRLTKDDVRGMIALARSPSSHRGRDEDGSYRRRRGGRGGIRDLHRGGCGASQGERRRSSILSPSLSAVPAGVNAPGKGVGAVGLVVLAPDRAGTGTNALLLRPPRSMPFAFGAGSYARHLMLAREHGVAVATYRAAGTAFDVDRPADLAELRAGGLWPLVGGRVVQG